MSELDEQKSTLRQKMMLVRRDLPLIGSDAGHFLQAPFFTSSRIVAGYWPMAGELDIRPVLEAWAKQGNKCALPVVIQKNAPLVFRAWHPGDVLAAGPHKTFHPGEEKMVMTPDVVLVPLLAFDMDGGRLGFGGGYYDRTLGTLDAIKVGVAYDEQEVPEVPMNGFDQRMDWIITPTRAIECKS